MGRINTKDTLSRILIQYSQAGLAAHIGHWVISNTLGETPINLIDMDNVYFAVAAVGVVSANNFFGVTQSIGNAISNRKTIRISGTSSRAAVPVNSSRFEFNVPLLGRISLSDPASYNKYDQQTQTVELDKIDVVFLYEMTSQDGERSTVTIDGEIMKRWLRAGDSHQKLLDFQNKSGGGFSRSVWVDGDEPKTWRKSGGYYFKWSKLSHKMLSDILRDGSKAFFDLTGRHHIARGLEQRETIKLLVDPDLAYDWLCIALSPGADWIKKIYKHAGKSGLDRTRPDQKTRR